MAAEAKPLLITGADGFLGRALLGRDDTIVGLSRQRETRRCVLADVTDPAALAAALDGVQPQAVAHAAALASPDRCEQEPALSAAVNVQATRTLAQLCAERSIPLLFTSTDLVFDGSRQFSTESDAPAPLSVYGQHKYEAEQAVLDAGFCVARLALLYGPEQPFVQRMARVLAGREPGPVTLFADEFRTPMYVEDAVDGLLLLGQRLQDSRRPRLVHLAGPERISRLEMGRRMARIMNGDAAGLAPSLRGKAALPAPRPKDVSLDISLARSLGFAPRSLDEGLRVCAQTIFSQTGTPPTRA